MSLSKEQKQSHKKVQFHLPSLSESFTFQKPRENNTNTYYNTINYNDNFKKINHRIFERLPMINTEIEFINNLSFDENTEKNIFDSSIKLTKEKEIIDNNIEVINKRIGKKVETEITNIEHSQDEIKSNQSREFFIKYEMMKNEKAMEEEILNLKKNLEECKEKKNNIMTNISNLLKIINDYEFDIQFLNSDDYFLRLAQNRMKDIQINDSKSVVSKSPKKHKKQKSNEKIDSFFLKTLELKEQTIRKEKKNEVEDLLNKTINQYNNYKEEYRNIQKEYKEKKLYLENKVNFLSDYYHKKLYEGLDIRSEGLIWIMKAIWNLGKNIQISFFPTFLDKHSINYLFKVAHKNVKITKIKEEIQQYRKELDSQFDIIHKQTKGQGFFRTKINKSLNMRLLPRLSLKKRKIMGNNENNNFINLKNIGKILSKKNPYSKVLENPIMEKISKLAVVSNFIEYEIIQLKRVEMDRLFKEFFENKYEQRYKVNLETVVGALVGEGKKDNELMKYHRMKKEYYDNMRYIQYFNLKAERAQQIQDINGKNNNNNKNEIDKI